MNKITTWFENIINGINQIDGDSIEGETIVEISEQIRDRYKSKCYEATRKLAYTLISQ